MKKTRMLTVLSATVAAAMLLSFIESLIPSFIPVPGVKLGLANAAVIFAMYKLGEAKAAAVSLVRVALSALLFGSAASLIYSLSGAVFSFLLMVVSRRIFKLHTVGVSVLGGVAHNLGQITAAAIVMGTASIVYYLPVLIFSGTIAGITVGLASNELIKRIKI